MASEKQLEGTGVSRKSDPYSQIIAPPSTVVVGGRKRSSRPTVTPNIAFSADLYRRMRWGAHLNKLTARGIWSLPESKLHINYLELKAVFLDLKEFQDLCSVKIVLVATDNTHT